METNGLQPWSQKQEAFLFQFFDGETSQVIRRGDPNWREDVQAWLDRADKEGFRAWNSKFDYAFIEAAGFKMPRLEMLYDGMLTAHILNERRSVALKNVAKELFGEQAADLQKEVKAFLSAERARRKKAAKEAGTELVEPNYSDVPDELIKPYGLEDVILTRKVSDVYDPILEKTPELKELYEFEREVMGALYEVEKYGVPADRDAYNQLEFALVTELEILEDKCIELAGNSDFNPNSSKQIYAALQKREADLSFVEGESMDKENLETVDDDLARAVLRFRAEKKAYSTYVRPMITRSYNAAMRAWKEPFIAPDGRIHANYRQVGARTGRMSCSDPNIQNQPRDDLRLRYCIAAEPGYKLVSCDLSNVEMRILAAYAGKHPDLEYYGLIDAIRDGVDLHELTAENLGFKDRRRAEGVYESARQQGKTFNFSVVYGAGVKKIQKSFKVSRSDAQLYFRRYHESYPEVKRLMNKIQYKLEDQGYIKSTWGRRYRCDDPRKEGFKFLNYLIQGTAADLFKQTLVNLREDGIPVVAVVHDEILAHVPEADAEDAKAKIIHRLTDHPRITNLPSGFMPLEADGHIVDRWSQVKDPDFVPDFVQENL